jgi:putative ABC transport system permease protein
LLLHRGQHSADRLAPGLSEHLHVVLEPAPLLEPLQHLAQSANVHVYCAVGCDHRAWRSALVICQIALALALVTGASLLLRSFSNLVREDVGFERDRAAVLQVMAWERQPGPAALRRFFDEARSRLATLPGVEAVGAVSAMPFIEANIDIRSPLTLVGRSPAAGQQPSTVSVTIVTPGYFEAVGGRLLQGRLLDARDAPGRTETALISDALALRHFRDRNPIGTQIEVWLQRRPHVVEVLGVVASFRHEGLDASPREEVFLPHAQAPFGAMTFVLRTGMDPAAVLGPARAAIWSIDPQQAFSQAGTLQQLVGDSVADRRFTLWVVGVFAGLSLLLAAAGVYGVLSTVVVLYRRELGVRIALGAGTLRVVGIVLGRGMRLAVAGVAIGLLCAAAGARLLRGFLYGVEPIDPLAFAGAAWLMLMVTGIASYLPARRAAATDPARVLGAE